MFSLVLVSLLATGFEAKTVSEHDNIAACLEAREQVKLKVADNHQELAPYNAFNLVCIDNAAEGEMTDGLGVGVMPGI